MFKLLLSNIAYTQMLAKKVWYAFIGTLCTLDTHVILFFSALV